MLVQGLLGAFDTIYFHEYRARLPAGGRRARPELLLHAVRDFVYAVLFCTLPFVAWRGAWAWALALLIAAEIAITMADFAIETRTRGTDGVTAGERITHGAMAIVYGAMLGRLAPELLAWSEAATGFVAHALPLPAVLTTTLALMGVGVLASGLRDLWAAL
jgi:hypothetical protein